MNLHYRTILNNLPFAGNIRKAQPHKSRTPKLVINCEQTKSRSFSRTSPHHRHHHHCCPSSHKTDSNPQNQTKTWQARRNSRSKSTGSVGRYGSCSTCKRSTSKKKDFTEYRNNQKSSSIHELVNSSLSRFKPHGDSQNKLEGVNPRQSRKWGKVLNKSTIKVAKKRPVQLISQVMSKSIRPAIIKETIQLTHSTTVATPKPVATSPSLKIDRKCMDLIHKKYELQQRIRLKARAATRIQAWWRGYLVRRRLEAEYLNLLKEQDSLVSSKSVNVRTKSPESRKHAQVQTIKEQQQEKKPAGELDNLKKTMQQQYLQVLALKVQLKRNLEEVRMFQEKLSQEYHKASSEQDILIKEEPQQQVIEYKSPFEPHTNKEKHKQVPLPKRTRRRRPKLQQPDPKIKQRMAEQLSASSPLKQYYTNWRAIKDYLAMLSIHIKKTSWETCSRNLSKNFGYDYKKRLALLHNNQEEPQAQPQTGNDHAEPEIVYFVIPDTVYYEIQDIFFEASTEHERTFRQAVFNCLNEILGTFRPFYSEQSEPYPWSKHLSTSKKIDLGEALRKSQQIMYAMCANFCGVLQSEDEASRDKHNEKAIDNFLVLWVRETMHMWGYWEDQKTQVGLEVTDKILDELVEQFCRRIIKIRDRRQLVL